MARKRQADVAREARQKGVKVHVGRLFGIAGIKGHGLPVGSPLRKYKGRFVFEGSNVRDEFGQSAGFADMSSAPATLEAFNAVDAHGLLPGHGMQGADAGQAYVSGPSKGDGHMA